MSPKVKAALYDILKAIEEIDSFFHGKIKEFTFFQNDIRTKRAVERDLEIIGEAANRIFKIHPEIDLPNIRQIIDTRNRIIHGYDTVSDEILWVIITEYLSDLRTSVKAVLDS